MKLFFHPFKIESKIPAEPIRMSRLDWIVLNGDDKLCRGFSFIIDPSDWDMTEDGAINESTESFNRMAVLGHPVETVLKKFIGDHDVCDHAFCYDVADSFELLIYEATKSGIRATTKIKNRYSLQTYFPGPPMPPPDFTNGIQSMVDFYNRFKTEILSGNNENPT